MCLDPRPERLRRPRRSTGRVTLSTQALAGVLPSRRSALPLSQLVVRPSALWAIDTLAGDDDLVARGWVVLSREA